MAMKIFDSLTHPSFDGKISNLQIDNPQLIGALAVPLPNTINNLDDYFESCVKSEFYKPVALLNLEDSNLEAQIKGAKRKGFVGVKVHPRFSKWRWTDPAQDGRLGSIFSACQEVDLPILFCTYFTSVASLFPRVDPVIKFADLLERYPKVRLLLMHGGGHRLLDFIELARFNENILLDLSFTLMKFEGSSVDSDIIFSLKNFNKRVCYGSDAPYCDSDLAISRLSFLLSKISPDPEYVENHRVWSQNIMEFLQI